MKKIFLFLTLLSCVAAHKLYIFSYIENNKVYINSYFASGSPCKKCKVYIDGKELGKTNDNGDFITPATKNSYSITVDAGAGHIAKDTLKGEDFAVAKEEQKQQKKEENIKKILGVLLISSIFAILWFIKRR